MSFNRFTAQLLLVVIAAIVVSVVWQSVPLIQSRLLGLGAEPRVVMARGELADDEKATIDLFEARRDSVVFISTAGRVVDPWTRNVYEQPRGTGSGFLWDDLGHVITNAHVIAGASRANVRLADRRTYPAELVGADPAHDIAVQRIAIRRHRHRHRHRLGQGRLVHRNARRHAGRSVGAGAGPRIDPVHAERQRRQRRNQRAADMHGAVDDALPRRRGLGQDRPARPDASAPPCAPPCGTSPAASSPKASRIRPPQHWSSAGPSEKSSSARASAAPASIARAISTARCSTAPPPTVP